MRIKLKIESITWILIIQLVISGFMNSCTKSAEPVPEDVQESINNQTIYQNNEKYCAFCDITYFEGKFYIAFRCANNHVPTTELDENGYIKIMSSLNGKDWKDEIDVVDELWDLRDPCFCIDTNDNILSMNYGLCNYEDRSPKFKNKRVVFSNLDGKLKIDHRDIIDISDYSHFWIWKVYYYDEKYWGVAYYPEEYPKLVYSKDGISYQIKSELPVNGNETALLFEKGEVLAVTRPFNDQSGRTFLSISDASYEKWTVYESDYTIASPEIVKTDKDLILIAGRSEFGVSLFLYNSQSHTLCKYLNLFALGNYSDKGYPGMLYRNGYLYIVYYACNDNRTRPSIYMTTIKLD